MTVAVVESHGSTGGDCSAACYYLSDLNDDWHLLNLHWLPALIELSIFELIQPV